MNQIQKHSIIKLAYFLIDIFFIYLSIFLACWVRQSSLGFPVTFTSLLFDETNAFRFVFLLWLFTTIYFNSSNGLYTTRRDVLEGIEIWSVTKSVVLSSLVVVVAFYVLKLEGFPRTIFIIALSQMIVFLSIWRVFKRIFVEFLVAGGYNNINALIIGAGKVGVALAQEIEKRPGLGIKVVGFLDDLKGENGDKANGMILGKISDFASIARRHFVTKMFITIHHDSQAFLKLLEQAKEMGVSVRVVPQGFDLTTGEFYKYNIGLIPILEYSDGQNLRKQAGKRLFDFVFGLLLFIFLIPAFFIIALIIKLDSDGPVLYRSKRYGRNGKIFYMYKFRSMVQDAEKVIDKLRHNNEVDGPIFKIKKDPRITPVGCILRRSSLDELPQILNVIRGDMSLVGPRPLPIEQIEKEDLRQLMRLEIRPGITGLWQIRGRSDISFTRLLKWDIWYINNWSFWLDLNILYLTIPVVIKAKGAY